MDSQPLVAVRALGRRFGARHALRGVDLTLARGQIVGIAGPNGAGKSTLLQILAGLLRPSSGNVSVFGLDPWHERAQVMQRARFAFAPPGLWPNLTAREHLCALAGTGQPTPPRAEIDATLDLVGLGARADDRAGTFSFGMRQRLALAIALLPRPELLVLDEPGEGLDPLAVLELRAILRDLRDRLGVSVLLSSHLLLELDALVDHLLVLEQGEVLCAGPPQALRGPARLHLRVNDGARATSALTAHGLHMQADEPDTLWLVDGRTPALAEVHAVLARAGVELHEFARVQSTLEDALLTRLRDRAAVANR